MCPRRHGESHQGTAVDVVCRPHELPQLRRESFPAFSFKLCLRVDGDLASHGLVRHVNGEGPVQHDSREVVQDRGGGDGVGAADRVFDAERMPDARAMAEGVPLV